MKEVRSSFERARAADFPGVFYSTLLASDARIRAKFERTNFAVQHEMLMHGVHALLDYVKGIAVGKLAMERLSRSHGPRGLGVTADMYERWMEAFLKTLRRTDPQFDDALDAKWRQALGPALEELVAKGRSSRE